MAVGSGAGLADGIGDGEGVLEGEADLEGDGVLEGDLEAFFNPSNGEQNELTTKRLAIKTTNNFILFG